VDGDAVYFPDWGGNLYAVKKDSGHLIWSRKIFDYNGSTDLSLAKNGPYTTLKDLQEADDL